MATTLYYHPYSRASGTLFALEEIGRPYELEFVDLMAGAHKEAPVSDKNPMGKLPTLVDDGVVVSEAAAIALYLADRYALGRLAPPPDDPRRGTYLRWSLFAPSVIEPGCLSQLKGFEVDPKTVGWGDYPSMLTTIRHAINDGPWLLGDTFSMADVIFGGTLRFMLTFDMIEKRSEFVAYVERLNERPASQKAREINDRVLEERGLKGS